MTTPYPPQPPAAAPQGNDKVTLFGVLGIVLSLICCPPVGIVLGVLSMNEAKRVGKPTTLGLIAIILGALNIVVGVVIGITRMH